MRCQRQQRWWIKRSFLGDGDEWWWWWGEGITDHKQLHDGWRHSVLDRWALTSAARLVPTADVSRKPCGGGGDRSPRKYDDLTCRSFREKERCKINNSPLPRAARRSECLWLWPILMYTRCPGTMSVVEAECSFSHVLSGDRNLHVGLQQKHAMHTMCCTSGAITPGVRRKYTYTPDKNKHSPLWTKCHRAAH